MPQITYNGVTVNLVTVTGTFLVISLAGQGNASGALEFAPSDLPWDSTLAIAGIISPIGANLDANGQFGTVLLAMDNTGMSANWAWVVSGTVSGTAIQPRKLTVDYANGDAQDFTALLETSVLL